MEDIEFSDAFCRFVQSYLPSVETAELLLQACRTPDMAVQAKQRDGLRAAGLLDESYRYRPASPELAAQVATLAQAYEQRPVTLIRLIYALRDTRIRSFADAFRLRKD